MAVFNPTVDPTKARDYRESQDVKVTPAIHPIGQEPNTILPTGVRHVDISKQLEYTGAAEAVSGFSKLAAATAHAADETVKDHISNQLFTRMNNEREAYTAALNVVKGTTGARGGGGSATLDEVNTDQGDIAGGNEDVLSARAEARVDPPAEVAAVPAKLTQLTAARGAGKISPTEYISRQNAILKDVRWNWSGWREYVDREASQIIGGNPANMYIRSMLHDINASAGTTKADPQHARDVAEAKDNADILAPELREKVIAGVPGAAAEMRRTIAPILGARAATTKAVADWNAETKNEEVKAFKAKKAADTSINGIIQENFSVHTLTGLGTTTAKQVEDYVLGVQAGSVAPPTAVEAKAFEARILSQEAKARKEAYEFGDKPQADGRTFAESFPEGSAGYRKMVDGRIDAVFGSVKNALQNKDYGLIYNIAKLNEAATDDMKQALRLSPIGQSLAMAAAVENMAPGSAFSKLVNAEFIGTHKGDISELGATLANNSKLRAITQPDLTPKGITHTLNGSIQKTIQAAEEGKLPDAPKTIQELVRIVDKIPDPNYPDDAKIGIVRHVFGGDAAKTLENFRKEGTTDPVTGKPVQNGKFSVFERLAKPDIGVEVAKLDKLHPELGLMQMYKDTIETWTAKDLLGPTIQNLNKDAHVFRHATLTYNSDPQPGEPRIVLKFDPKAEQDITYSIPRVQHDVNLLNRAFAGLTGVAKSTGTDVNRYLFNFLTNAGYDFSTGPIQGFQDSLLRGLKSSREEVLREQERLRTQYRTTPIPGARTPSLGE